MRPAGRQYSPCAAGARQEGRCLFLRTLSMKITQNTVDQIAVLRERFSKPQSCRSKEGLALSLRQWKVHLDKLQAAGSEPSKATFASSLRAIIGTISELKKTVEIADFVALGHVRRLYQVVSKRREHIVYHRWWPTHTGPEALGWCSSLQVS